MENWLTKGNFMDKTLSILYKIASEPQWWQVIISSLILIKAWTYLNDHKKKVKVERQRISIEESLRAMYKVDQTIKGLFYDYDVKSSEEYKKEVEWINSFSKPFALEGFSEINSFLKIQLCYSYKVQLTIKAIRDSESNLLLNLELVDNYELEEAGRNYIDVCASIMSFVSQDFVSELKNSKNATEFYNDLVAKFPINLNDDSKPLIKEYNHISFILREKMKSELKMH